MTIRVVVADDDLEVRSALTAALSDDQRFVVVGEAATGPDAVLAVTTQHPDVVLLDVRMPGGGVAATAAIHQTGLPVTVVAVTAKVSQPLVMALVDAGAQGVLLKGRLGHLLPDLVARCYAGEVILPGRPDPVDVR